jgi:hypothetical protein
MRPTITAALSVCLLAFSSQAATVAFYEFNGSGTAEVGSTIFDSVGGHHGTVTGGDLLFGSDPLVGSFLSFNADGPSVGGAGNRVVVPGSSAFLFTVDQGFTIEAIFRSTQTLTNGILVSKGADVTNPDSQWWLRHRGDGRLQGLVEGDGNTTEDSASSPLGVNFTDGLWHHVAAVYNGTGASRRIDLFVDGIWQGADTAIGTLGTIGGTDDDPVIFGEFATLAANRSFEGDIAALRFSNTALIPSEFLAVPEPTSAALLLAGLAAGVLWRRRS